jgi:hypothetical protein
MMRALLDWNDGKLSWSEVQQRRRNVDGAYKRDRDECRPDFESLWPFCDPELLNHVTDCLITGRLAASETGFVATDAKSGEQQAASAAALFIGQKLHVDMLRGLKEKISEELEKKSADTRADTEEIFAENAPRNESIMTLYWKIKREGASGKPEIQIALEFTEGDRKRAESLLRGVRRLRNRLSSSLF